MLEPKRNARLRRNEFEKTFYAISDTKLRNIAFTLQTCSVRDLKDRNLLNNQKTTDAAAYLIQTMENI